MKKSDIFVGPIYKDDIENKDTNDLSNKRTICAYAVLIKVSNGRYVWLKDLDSLVDIILFYMGYQVKTIDVHSTTKDTSYTEEDQLIPYYEDYEQNQNISVKKLKLDVLLDPRFPGGIEHY